MRIRRVFTRLSGNETIVYDIKMFFALNNGLLDASISAWDGKRNWDSIRPICAVRWLQRGSDRQGAKWALRRVES